MKKLSFLSLLCTVLVVSCDNYKKSSSTSGKPDAFKEPNNVYLFDNKGLNFESKLGDTTEFGENLMIEIKCKLTNKTDRDINYLCQSCNGLDYYLILKPDTYEVMPFLNCNATYPMIGVLNKGDSLIIKTQILKLKGSARLEKVGLDFRVVDKFIPFDTLREYPERIEKIYHEETEEKNIIWSR